MRAGVFAEPTHHGVKKNELMHGILERLIVARKCRHSIMLDAWLLRLRVLFEVRHKQLCALRRNGIVCNTSRVSSYPNNAVIHHALADEQIARLLFGIGTSGRTMGYMTSTLTAPTERIYSIGKYLHI
jgi:hypothetical protein